MHFHDTLQSLHDLDDFAVCGLECLPEGRESGGVVLMFPQYVGDAAEHNEFASGTDDRVHDLRGLAMEPTLEKHAGQHHDQDRATWHHPDEPGRHECYQKE